MEAKAAVSRSSSEDEATKLAQQKMHSPLKDGKMTATTTNTAASANIANPETGALVEPKAEHPTAETGSPNSSSSGPYQKIKLIFIPKQNSTAQPKLSLQPCWVYYLDKSPLETIKMTLRKFNFNEIERIAVKYRIYRVREDPKTRYRYVTEILNAEEGRQLIGGEQRKGCQVLVTHHSMVRQPQEDFKNMLDEAERQTIRLKASNKKPETNDNFVWKAADDGKDPEPQTQSQSAIGHVGSQPSDTSSQRSGEGGMAQPRVRRQYPKRNPSCTGGPEEIFPGHELDDFRSRYPLIEFCGRANDLYRCEQALNYIKETSRQVYETMDDLQHRLINQLNKIHRNMTREGNYKMGNDVAEIYEHRVTSSYVNVRCKISRKCRFMVWYKFEGVGDQPHSISWFRTINNNHDLVHHRNEGIF